MNLPKLSIEIPPADLAALQSHFEAQWLESIRPKANEYGLRQLPREPGNPNKFLTKFETDKHIYTIIGDAGIGFDRYTMFQKRSLQRAFGRDFQQVYDALQQIKLGIAGETTVSKLRAESIVAITALQDSVADFGNEQFDAALWMSTLHILREDETISGYSETIAEEKIKDWAAYGYSEVDFFLLTGNFIPGYLNAFKQAISDQQRLRQRFMDVIDTNSRLSRESPAS